MNSIYNSITKKILLFLLILCTSYQANHNLHRAPEIENIRQFESGRRDSVRLFSTIFGFTDFPGLGDGYYGVDYKKGSAAGDSLRYGSFTTDEFYDGETFDEIELTDSDQRFQIGDTAVVEIHSIGEKSVEFLIKIDTELYDDGTIAPPPSKVGTNFSGGAIGYFIISDARQAMIIIE